ncbi:BadF/BadG/BcrA/BcrD ATPase family protein [Labrenzia sp. PHM005]|uniref:BadF/BadG/BcrA/BcrD ATPase family protein n=1 Tax=Labrenzia sp. PHM005 TaxID=2590016 RepID=UPI0011402925|nr:BadF/BadG/BcrA/BcrD ATPase family protein [Labrenzia sp. PHM005]QDG76142.1 ATPase [Labrenzia sp. PHM005]
MFEPAHSCILAVDGGGTRCRLALVSGAGNMRVEVGAANVTTDIEAAVHEINLGLSSLSGKAGLALEDLGKMPAYLGLAGFHAEKNLARLNEGLPLRFMKVEDDRPAALQGALGARNGALIHSGTGSFFGVQVGGKKKFSGGWGAILGDCGSAAWFGKSALALVLDAEDGLLEKTTLTQALLVRFKTPSGILEFANNARPADFGELAPIVLDVPNDPVAQILVQRAASHFERNLRAIGWSADLPVCLTGGLAPHLAPYLTADVQSNLSAVTGTPLDGAVSLARMFAEEVQVSC